MYVVVVGGGNVGYYLTKELLAAGHEVVVIEEEAGRARQIADELGSIVVANDGCEGRYQAEAGMGRADVMAAVTGDDAVNLAACQIAKMRFNVPRSIARINDPKNEKLFRQLGHRRGGQPDPLHPGRDRARDPDPRPAPPRGARGRRGADRRGPARRRLARHRA